MFVYTKTLMWCKKETCKSSIDGHDRDYDSDDEYDDGCDDDELKVGLITDIWQ